MSVFLAESTKVNRLQTMPRRQILSDTELEGLLALPETDQELIRLYEFSEHDLSIINQHRGEANRLGFAVQLCFMRYPGIVLPVGKRPEPALLKIVCERLRIKTDVWEEYAERDETRRDHAGTIRLLFGFKAFTMHYYKTSLHALEKTAQQTDRGIVLALELLQNLRNQKILLPPSGVIERICAETITRGARIIYASLTESLSIDQQNGLDELLVVREGTSISRLSWLRGAPVAANAKYLLEHIERLQMIDALKIPLSLQQKIHQNRLLKLAREGGQMTAQHLNDLEQARRRATLIAVVWEARATIIDEIVDLHDRIIGAIFGKAKRSYAEQFQNSGKDINNTVLLFWRIGNALLDAKETGEDAFSAIESIVSWDSFTKNVAQAGRLARPESFDYIHLVGDYYS